MTRALSHPGKAEPGVDIHVREVAKALGVHVTPGVPRSWDWLLEVAVGLYWRNRPRTKVEDAA